MATYLTHSLFLLAPFPTCLQKAAGNKLQSRYVVLMSPAAIFFVTHTAVPLSHRTTCKACTSPVAVQNKYRGNSSQEQMVTTWTPILNTLMPCSPEERLCRTAFHVLSKWDGESRMPWTPYCRDLYFCNLLDGISMDLNELQDKQL